MIGCGYPIIVNFYAPINKQSPDDTIHYDFKNFGEDIMLIQNDEEKYCLKQVYKICFYVQKLYHIEVLTMKCEFVKDHNGTIWFQYAQEIKTRNNFREKKA